MNALVDQVQQIVSKRKLEIDALKDQDAFRKEFLGNIAHELKTPLASPIFLRKASVIKGEGVSSVSFW